MYIDKEPSMPVLSACSRIVVLTVSLGLGLAYPASAAEEPDLEAVMEQLGQQLGTLSQALAAGDFLRVEETALAIANHPRPNAAQRQRIIRGLGADADGFSGGDRRLHDAAMAVVAAARDEQIETALTAHDKLLRACVACHGQFRERVKALLAAPR
jgi:cytochrome c556